jgi:hypothetical protein
MLRLVSTAVLTSILGVPLVLPASPEPPSSIESAHGTVKIVHVASRVSACTAEQARCVAELQPADASLDLTLAPVDEASITAKKKREAVHVSCPKESGGTVSVDVSAGTWLLSGAGSGHRFYVGDGDEVDISIKSQRGSCKRVKDECLLETSSSKHDVRVPAAARR